MTAYRVELAPTAARAFDKPSPDIRSRLARGLGKLASDAASKGRIGGKAVKTIRGLSDSFHRLRVGDYRVMYDVMDEERMILALGVVHRSDLERWIRNR